MKTLRLLFALALSLAAAGRLCAQGSVPKEDINPDRSSKLAEIIKRSLPVETILTFEREGLDLTVYESHIELSRRIYLGSFDKHRDVQGSIHKRSFPQADFGFVIINGKCMLIDVPALALSQSMNDPLFAMALVQITPNDFSFGIKKAAHRIRSETAAAELAQIRRELLKQ